MANETDLRREIGGKIYHLERPLKPDEHIVVCRECGKPGIEDSTDPMPGLCPRCFELWIQSRIEGALVADGLEPEEAKQKVEEIKKAVAAKRRPQ